ncbi:MAG: methylated-DNA--[protein]-cysteine S-methyltransferase [Xanthomonadales bacterium]|jgi:methylated-DNA-protein-cysteine methyltransferase-like protein|nr:methylated-DNA--[protein]-cysteine S-methyltransferase [Xanthomonadales bacterium]
MASESGERKVRKPDREWAEAVWKVVADIPPGFVLTYGEVARLSGAPRFARRVGQAMRWAPRDLKLPWHRVINAQGKISFPADSAAYQEQKDRLEAEGVIFLKGRIDLQRHGYTGALDHLFWADPDLQE